MKSAALLLVVLSQLATARIDPVDLNQIRKFQLQAGQVVNLTINLPRDESSDPSSTLFVVVKPESDNFEQRPNVTMTASSTPRNCNFSYYSFKSICRQSIATITKEVNVTAVCYQSCVFHLQAYISAILKLEFGKSLPLPIGSSQTLLTLLHMHLTIPQRDFNDLEFKLSYKAEESVSGKEPYVAMYANYGAQDVQFPQERNYQTLGVPMQQFHGEGIDLSKKQLGNATTVKLTLHTDVESTLYFESHANSQAKMTMLVLNQDKDIFESPGVTSKYLLNLTETSGNFSEIDVNVMAQVYAGQPEVIVYFDQSGWPRLQNHAVEGNLDFCLTPDFREEFNFKQLVYVEVTAQVQSYVVLTTFLSDRAYVNMTEATTYMMQVKQGDLQNYIFEETYSVSSQQSQQTMVYFKVKFKMISGSAFFAARICNQTSNEDCLLDSVLQIKSDKFKEQQDHLKSDIIKYYSLYELYVGTELKNCLVLPNNETQQSMTSYLCRIHYIGFDPARSDFEWGTTIYSRQHKVQLHEGQPFQDMVYDNTYNYFLFYPSDNIKGFTFYLTVLSGRATMLSSQHYYNPQKLFATFKQNDIRLASHNVIHYTAEQLQNPVIYIGVYGQERSQFLIHVQVEHKSPSERTVIKLVEQVSQYFTIKPVNHQLLFELNPTSTGPWVVEVVELAGLVDMTLLDVTNSTEGITVCTKTTVCRFATTRQKNRFYLNVTKKDQQSAAKIQVSYYPNKGCRIVGIGLTIFVEVPIRDEECVQMLVQQKDVLISYSQDLIHSLNTNATVSVQINGQSIGELKEHYRQFKKDEMATFCGTTTTGQYALSSKCVLRVKVKGDPQQTVSMQLTAYYIDSPVSLLDGVVFYYKSQLLQPDSPALFYYPLFSNKRPHLLVRSLTYNSYKVTFKWVNLTEYTTANNSKEMFPDEPLHIDSVTSFKINAYFRVIDVPTTQPQNCQDCLLLVAVHAVSENKVNSIQILVLEKEGALKAGQTITGSVHEEQFFGYHLKIPKDNSSYVLTISPDSLECLTAQINSKYDLDPQVLGQTKVLEHSFEKRMLYIKGKKSAQTCRYKISLHSSNYPLRQISLQQVLSLSLSNNETNYFLYYHETNSSFRVYEVITAGYIRGQATPILNKTLEETIKANNYLFGSSSIYDDLQIGPSSSDFCFGCYYLIKLTGAPEVEGEIGLTNLWSSVMLLDNSVARQKMNRQTREYHYYNWQNFEFSVKISVVYGQLSVSLSLEDDTIMSQTVSKDKQIKVAKVNGSTFYPYNLSISSKVHSTFSVQIVSHKALRLIQGYPIGDDFYSGESKNFSYKHSNNEQVYLYIIYDTFPHHGTKKPRIKLFHKDKGSKNQQQIQIKHEHIKQYGNIYALRLPKSSGECLIVLTTYSGSYIQLLVTRKSLTYLRPDQPFISTDSAIFEVYTLYSPIMLEVFACRDDIKLTASGEYGAIDHPQKDHTPLSLEHSNVGGHYVVTSVSKSHQFYVKVEGETSVDPFYKIQYSLMEESSTKMIPYKHFETADRTLTYEFTNDAIIFQFQTPILKDRHFKTSDLIIQYQFMLDEDVKLLRENLQCQFGQPRLAKSKQRIEPYEYVSHSQQKYTITNSELANTFKDSTVVYVGVVLTITIPVSKTLTFIYQPLQLSLGNLGIEKSTTNQVTGKTLFLIWVVLPCVIAAGLVMLSLRFCVSKWRQSSHHPEILIEEDVEMEEEKERSENAMNLQKKATS